MAENIKNIRVFKNILLTSKSKDLINGISIIVHSVIIFMMLLNILKINVGVLRNCFLKHIIIDKVLPIIPIKNIIDTISITDFEMRIIIKLKKNTEFQF